MWEVIPLAKLPMEFMIWRGTLLNGCMIGMITIIIRSANTKIRKDQTGGNGTPFVVGHGIVCLAISGQRVDMGTTMQRTFME